MEFLNLAAELAAKVDWRDVFPNPRVGCVIVRDGEVVSTSVHEKIGGAHAEVAALREFELKKDQLNWSSNSDLEVYVTLEPCDHFPGKKTGSCTERLLSLNPKKIVIGSLDKRFGGKNVQKLREAGIEVEVVSHKASENLSRVKPKVILKMAQTLDGKIGKSSTFNLQSSGVKEIMKKPVLISSLASRKMVHKWRSEVDAVLTTTGTVLSDNPLLDCRLVNKKCVPRLCVFGKRDLEKELNIFQFPEREIDFFSGEDLVRDFREMAEKGIETVLTECGAKMSTSLLKEGLVDEIRLFVAPRVMGKGTASFSEEIPFHNFALHSTEKVGDDILITFIKA